MIPQCKCPKFVEDEGEGCERNRVLYGVPNGMDFVFIDSVIKLKKEALYSMIEDGESFFFSIFHASVGVCYDNTVDERHPSPVENKTYPIFHRVS